jgi:putative transposase
VLFPFLANPVSSTHGGQCARAIEQTHDIRVEVVRRLGNHLTGTLHDAPPPPPPLRHEAVRGLVVLPKRWVVERAHGKNSIATAWVQLVEARVLLTRLALIR